MSNMSYCRFRNTAGDLRDCADHINDRLTDDERRARLELIRTCAKILVEVGFDIDAYQEPVIEETEEELAD